MNGDEIVKRAFDNLYGFSSRQDYEIQSSGGLATRSRIARRAGNLDGLLARSLSEPRGNGLLIIEDPEHVYKTRAYIASFRRDLPITWNRDDSLPGTDLWYEDFLPKRAKDWAAQTVQETLRNGRKSWLVRLEPKGVPSAYERADYWFDQELPIAPAAEFYRDNHKVRSLEVDPNDVKETDGYFVPTRLTFRGKFETTVTISNIKVRQYDDKFFTIANLRKENRP
jgi:hypothetical protein